MCSIATEWGINSEHLIQEKQEVQLNFQAA